jgi:Xaa-Pro aminopeptidase
MKHASSLVVLAAAFALSPAFAASPAGAQAAQLAEVKSIELRGDGQPVCGLGAAFHAGRRAALRKALGEGVVVVRGLPDSRDYVAFRQDKTFWYLTGIESPGASLVMDCKSGREVLLLPDPNKMSEIWEGEMWDAGDAWVKELAGFSEVLPTRDFEKAVGELLKATPKAWVSLHPNIGLSGCYDRASPYDQRIAKDPFDGRVNREQALSEALAKKFDVEVGDLAAKLHEIRRVKQPEEIAACERASRAGAAAMVEAMRSTRPGLGEWEIDSLMTWMHRVEGAAGPAYQPICGSGANSLVLHYSASSRRMLDGEVLLVDYAPELDHFICDITRTWPVNGKFSARQAELYDAVLEAQKAGIAATKPGVRIRDVNAACDKVLTDRGFGGFRRHRACHYVGMEVHDVGDGDKELEPGVVFTIEPGLYEAETGIGIRIEDVVLVTANGAKVLTAGAPRERAEIEALVASEGILDRLLAR